MLDVEIAALTFRQKLEVSLAIRNKRVWPSAEGRMYNLKQSLMSVVGKQKFRRLEVDHLKELALQIVPFENFGNLNEEALEVLVRSLNNDVPLHALGKSLVAGDIIKSLCWRLGVEEIYRMHPAVNDIEIKNPVFIIGFPRSGTTLLHALLARDNDHRWMPSWEANSPLPEGPDISREVDPRLKAARLKSEKMLQNPPEHMKMHYVAYDEPDECFGILKSSFVSGGFWWATGATEYLQWLQAQSFTDPYKLHKRYLKIMSAMHDRPRWLLKCPSHLSHIAVIKQVYPGAKFVHIHRDPMKSLSSGASLSAVIRKSYVKKICLAKVGSEVSSVNHDVISEYMEQREKLNEADIVDVHFHELMQNPNALIKKIYKHFSFSYDDAMAARVDEYLACNPRNKFGSHKYSLSKFALFEGQEREKYAAYMSKFNVPVESV